MTKVTSYIKLKTNNWSKRRLLLAKFACEMDAISYADGLRAAHPDWPIEVRVDFKHRYAKTPYGTNMEDIIQPVPPPLV